MLRNDGMTGQEELRASRHLALASTTPTSIQDLLHRWDEDLSEVSFFLKCVM